MKKVFIILAMMFCFCLSTEANWNGGLLQRQNEVENNNEGLFKRNKTSNVTIENENSTNEAPLSGGLATLITFGAAYVMLKNKKKC